MSIYSELLRHAQERGKYKIDLINKSLKIGKKYYIKDGVVKVDDELITMADVKNLYKGYIPATTIKAILFSCLYIGGVIWLS